MTYITKNAHQLRIPRIEEPEIWNVIAQLKNSAAGHDSLPGSIIKQCADKYIVPLSHIINLSITKGYFPEEFKLAKVLPIFKSGDKQNVQNYRPISILSFFSKIFEKIMPFLGPPLYCFQSYLQMPPVCLLKVNVIQVSSIY